MLTSFVGGGLGFKFDANYWKCFTYSLGYLDMIFVIEILYESSVSSSGQFL